MNDLTKEKFGTVKIHWVVISLSVLIGTIIRFKGLGTWSLALDEYYIIKSSEYILEHGLPQFPNGGYYIRGILLQYMIAPLLSLGVKAELAGRIYTVIASLITIPALYLIAKRVGNQLIATLVVVIFSLSIWEIEFARFARMYTPFQAIFTWYIYFALKDYLDQSFKNYKWLLLLSAISFLLYEGSIFLAVFNFVPFVLNRKIKIGYIFGALVTFFGSAFFNLFDFRNLNSNPILPPEYFNSIKSGLASSPIKIPKVLMLFAFDGLMSSLLTLTLISINMFLFYKLLSELKKKNFWSIVSISVLIILALLNQFGLFLLIFFILVFWNLIDITSSRKKVILLLGIIFMMNLIYWLGFGLLSSNWYSLFDDFSSYSTLGISKRLLVGFLNYPDNYYTLFNYFKTLPFLTIFSVVFSLLLFLYLIIWRSNDRGIKFLIGALIFVSLLATIPTLLYQETRYTFFAVPLLIIVVNYSLFVLIKLMLKNRNLIIIFSFAFISFSAFIYSNDFNLYHLTNIDADDINYRMIYNNSIKKHLYRRWDIETPVNYVKDNMAEDDIIIINENSQEYYLPKVDYYSFDFRHQAFIALSVEGGTKERWSNTKLLNNNKDLINLIETRKSTIWFLVFPEFYLREIDFYNKYEGYLVSQGVDKMVNVYRFPKIN